MKDITIKNWKITKNNSSAIVRKLNITRKVNGVSYSIKGTIYGNINNATYFCDLSVAKGFLMKQVHMTSPFDIDYVIESLNDKFHKMMENF